MIFKVSLRKRHATTRLPTRNPLLKVCLNDWFLVIFPISLLFEDCTRVWFAECVVRSRCSHCLFPTYFGNVCQFHPTVFIMLSADYSRMVENQLVDTETNTCSAAFESPVCGLVGSSYKRSCRRGRAQLM